MKITLRIEGQNKVFTTDFIPGRVYRRAIELTSSIDYNNLNPEVLDMMVDFVVDAFGKQFSRDDYYDGIDARQFISTVIDVIDQVTGSASEAIGVDESDPNSQQRA